MGILNTIIPKYFKMYFKYNWSCICILHFCKSETLSQNTVQVIVKLSFMLRKKCYQIEFFTVLISATLDTYGYLVTTTLQRDRSAPVERLFSKDALITTVLHVATGLVTNTFRNYFYWMPTSSNCVTVYMNNYCGLLCLCLTWIIAFNRWCIKNTHIDITYRNYFTECQLAVTVTFHVNNYCGLLCLCLTWMIIIFNRWYVKVNTVTLNFAFQQCICIFFLKYTNIPCISSKVF